MPFLGIALQLPTQNEDVEADSPILQLHQETVVFADTPLPPVPYSSE